MNSLLERIRWSPNFIREFGFLHGVRLLFGIVRKLDHKADRIDRFMVPGYSNSISLRRSVADHATFRQCMVMNQYDFRHFEQAKRLFDCYESIVATGRRPLIIDCGANIGLATLWFARHFPKAIIAAIEPDEDNFELLRRNTSHLGSRVQLVKGGIWNQSTTLRIKNKNSGSASFQVESTEASTVDTIRAFTIDEVVELCGNSSLLIVKLDIEGAQANLFKDNIEWVARTPLLTLELDDWLLPWQGTSRPFFACVGKLPFDYLMHKESIFCFQDIGTRASPNGPS